MIRGVYGFIKVGSFRQPFARVEILTCARLLFSERWSGLLLPPFWTKIRPRPYQYFTWNPQVTMAAILNRERLPRRKRESNGKRRRASSVSLFRGFINRAINECFKALINYSQWNQSCPAAALLETNESFSCTDEYYHQ